jgi:predicted 3-demethylubiquinone-9 3-methyltransferase (glyoxalase superfamily)
MLRRCGTRRFRRRSSVTEGAVLTIAFELDGQPFAALNGGPQFHFLREAMA